MYRNWGIANVYKHVYITTGPTLGFFFGTWAVTLNVPFLTKKAFSSVPTTTALFTMFAKLICSSKSGFYAPKTPIKSCLFSITGEAPGKLCRLFHCLLRWAFHASCCCLQLPRSAKKSSGKIRIPATTPNQSQRGASLKINLIDSPFPSETRSAQVYFWSLRTSGFGFFHATLE